MPGEVPFSLDQFTFGSLQQTQPRVQLDLSDRRPVAVALLAPSVEASVTMFIGAPAADALIEAGFEVSGAFQSAVRLEPDGIGRIALRPRDVPHATPLPDIVQVPCHVTEQRFTAQGAARAFEDTLVLEVEPISSQLPPLDVDLDPPAAVDLSRPDKPQSDISFVTVSSLSLRQKSIPARYAGPTQRLRITPQVWLNGHAIDPNTIRARLNQLAMGSWQRGVWSGLPHEIELPLPNAAHEAAQARLEIGVSARDLRLLARRTDESDRWRGTLLLTITVQRLDSDDALLKSEDFPSQVELAADLGASIDVNVVDVGSASVRLGPSDSPKRVKIAPYRRTIRTSGSTQHHNIRSALTLLLSADTRDPDPRIDLDGRIGSGDQWLPAVSHRDLAPAGGPIEIPIPFGPVLERIGLTRPTGGSVMRDGILELTFSYRSAPDRSAAQCAVVEIPIEIETTAPQWLACIDLGTSSTAIWLGKSDGSQPGRPLPLGLWLWKRIDRGHEEWSPDRKPEEQILIPSDIGLSSSANLRARFDPLSLGDLSLASGDRRDVGRRLAALGRHYDISVPFAPRSEIPDHLQQIIFDPKRKLIARTDRIFMSGGVYQAGTGGDAQPVVEVALPELLEDYFDELGGYVVPHALLEMAEEARQNELLDRWIEGLEGLGAVLTHPSGIAPARKALYEKAGRRFLAAISGSGAPAMRAGAGWVKLIPEALAAGRYGIGDAIATHRFPDGKQTFGAIDIGAGTYDVTLVEAQVRAGTLASWNVRSHFGVTIGGLDLDRAIAARVCAILETAANQVKQEGLLEFELDLPNAVTDLHSRSDPVARARGQNLLRELQIAKQNLTKELLERRAYDWSRAQDLRLDIVVGKAARKDWPVRATQQAIGSRGYDGFGINNLDAGIAIDRGDEGAVQLILSLGYRVFEQVPPRPRRNDPRSVVDFMGEVLPAMTIAEVQRLGMAPPRWIVTGRAALWPPVYHAIEQTIAAQGGRAGAMAREMPYSPDVMKKAVLLGAVGLAQEPHLGLGEEALNALAVVTYGGPGEGAPALQFSPVKSVHYLDGAQDAGGKLKLEVPGRFDLVRSLPGLDDAQTRARRLELLQEMGVPPWEPVATGISPIRHHSEPDRPYYLSWQQRGSQLFITLEDESGASMPPIGPIDCRGTIYGDF